MSEGTPHHTGIRIAGPCAPPTWPATARRGTSWRTCGGHRRAGPHAAAGAAATSGSVDGPGYPEPGSYPVAECLGTVLAEEWEHRRYAERDLDVLTGRR